MHYAKPSIITSANPTSGVSLMSAAAMIRTSLSRGCRTTSCCVISANFLDTAPFELECLPLHIDRSTASEIGRIAAPTGGHCIYLDRDTTSLGRIESPPPTGPPTGLGWRTYTQVPRACSISGTTVRTQGTTCSISGTTVRFDATCTAVLPTMPEYMKGSTSVHYAPHQDSLLFSRLSASDLH